MNFNCILTFTGALQDPISGVTHMGNGYRAYDPNLMRFKSPDSMSPFKKGGINTYTYCEADPINRSDPNGHFSIGNAVGIITGILGLVLAPVTDGLSLGLLATAISTTAGVASIGLSIASGFTHNKATAKILGWTGLALGIISAMGAVTAERLMPQASSLVRFLGSRVAFIIDRTDSANIYGVNEVLEMNELGTTLDEQAMRIRVQNAKRTYNELAIRSGQHASNIESATTRAEVIRIQRQWKSWISWHRNVREAYSCFAEPYEDYLLYQVQMKRPDLWRNSLQEIDVKSIGLEEHSLYFSNYSEDVIDMAPMRSEDSDRMYKVIALLDKRVSRERIAEITRPFRNRLPPYQW